MLITNFKADSVARFLPYKNNLVLWLVCEVTLMPTRQEVPSSMPISATGLSFSSGILFHGMYRLPEWSACLITNNEVEGSILGTYTIIKCGLGLERVPPCHRIPWIQFQALQPLTFC